MKVNVVTYYVANRWGSMVEKQKLYGIELPRHEVVKKANSFLERIRCSGQQVYPNFDLTQEVR